MKNIVTTLLLVAGVAFPYVVGLHIEPVKTQWSGWALGDENHGVFQGVICNFDTVVYCELFAGSRGGGGDYHLSVLTNPGGSQIATANADGDVDHKWVKFNLVVDYPESIVKGKKLTFKFTRSGGDSIQFYFDSTDKYKHGCLWAGGLAYATGDLACRVMGRMNPVSDVWRACVNHGNDPPSGGADTAVAMAESMGVKWIREDFTGWDGWDWQRGTVMAMYNRYLSKDLSMMGMLCYGRDVESVSTRPPGETHSFSSYLPRNLWAEEGQTNYWAQYCHTIMDSLDSVKYWEVWAEQNTPWGPKDPDTAHDKGYKGSTPGPRGDGWIDTWRERCSLYVRLCYIAESVAHDLGGGRKIIGGASYRLLDGDGGDMMSGVNWLWNVFDLAERRYGGVKNCFDIVSTHPYMHYSWGLYFIEDVFRANLDTTRWVMSQAGYPEMELWATEYGWPRWNKNDSCRPMTDTLMQARNICQFYVSSIARQADPRGGYDRAFHYELTGHHRDSASNIENEGYGLLDTFPTQRRLPNGWAFTQESLLTGKRLNGRVMLGGTEDDSVRIYEFEDPASLKKTWVCWKNGYEYTVANIKLPARSDTSEATDLDYEGNPLPGSACAEASSGWLWRGIYARPKFITESTAVSRPELVAESLWISQPCSRGGPYETVYVRIRNRDSQRATPGGCTVQLTWNDSIVCSIAGTEPINANETKVVSFAWQLPLAFHGEGLLAANVNPGMAYVEREGTDDNQAYRRLFIDGVIGGTLDVAAPPGGKTDAPLLVCGLASMAYEKDSTGQTPADSVRALFAWYGARGDSVAHATDTTAWFPFCTDTALVFPRGCGVYRVQAQYRDSGANDSPFYGDSTDSIVVFDTVPPAGSIVVEGGRFASNSTRNLRLAASDSASGICDMRFVNRGRVNLARNGAFDPAGGYWSFTGTGSGYDTGLSMAKLTVGPTQAGVRQFVPAESISAYSGDSCVLEASILAHVHDGEATGEVSFWHFSTNENPEITDTLWELADSASYTGDLLSLTGRYNLSTRFLLATPAPESGWAWQGGMVRVRVQGVDGGTGSVWCDNVSADCYAPQASGYAWYGPFETLTTWDIGSGAGQHVVGMCLMDSAGAENTTPYADTIILDPTPPVVDISLPSPGSLVNGLVEATGWAYDPVECSGDTWFSEYRLSYRHWDSTNWLPVSPDSSSLSPAYPDSMASQGPAVHLGYWNTLGLDDGIYYLLLTACDSAANTSSCTTWVMVDQGFGGGGMRSGPEGGATGMGEGSCYIGSADGHVLHVSDDLAVLDTFSVCDSGSQAYVTALVEVAEDSLLVLDAANRRVHKLHRSGQHRRRLVSGLSQPVDLKQDTNGNLYLVDRGLHRIGKFRSNGTLVFTRGGYGADSLHFDSPEGIAVKGNLVFVADTKNDRIAVLDTSGNYKAVIEGDFARPTAVFATDNGAIYLTDGSDGKLKGITPFGGNIVTIGTDDSSKLKGLVPSGNRRNLFSIAAVPNKVYKLRIQSDESGPGGAQSGGRVNLPKTLALNQPFPNPARTRLNIAYALPRQTRVELKVYDVTGKLVKAIVNGEQKPGYYTLMWNRQDAKGRSCPCGVYFCTLAAENQRFSRKVILTE